MAPSHWLRTPFGSITRAGIDGAPEPAEPNTPVGPDGDLGHLRGKSGTNVC